MSYFLAQDFTEVNKKLLRQKFFRAMEINKFPDYSNYNCVNNAYQDFVAQFLSVIDFVAPTRTLRVKSNTKLWFDIGNLNA